MTARIDRMLDKILIKVGKSLSSERPPVFTEAEMKLLEDAQHIVMPLISKLAVAPNQSLDLTACHGVLAQALTQLRYHYERDDVWAKRLHHQAGEALCKHMPDFSRDCVIGIIGAFYEARLEIPVTFNELCLDMLAGEEETMLSPDELDAYGLSMIDVFFKDKPDLTAFELSNILFSSMHAMPPGIVESIIDCLISHPRVIAQDAAILFLLHPDTETRVRAIKKICELLENRSVTPASLRRLVAIRQWWPTSERQMLDQLIGAQRKRGIQFADVTPPPGVIRYHASIFDGTGVQLILIEIQEGKGSRFAGLLVKHEIGIRDAWITPKNLTDKELYRIKKQIQTDQRLPMFTVNEEYVARIVSHYIAMNNSNDETPEPNLLEIDELLGSRAWRAEFTNIDTALTALVQDCFPDGVSPAWIKQSLERSGDLMNNESISQSWFEVHPGIDALISRHTSIEKDKHKVNAVEALSELNTTGFEFARKKWMGQFFWMALMARSQPTRDNPELWKDFATLAYVLQQNWPMRKVPLMHSMMHDSLYISIESMVERSMHLRGV